MTFFAKMLALLILGAFLVNAVAADEFTYNGKPLASVDLGTDEGVKQFQGQWRYSDATIVDTEFFAPGAEGQPTGKMIKAKDISPRAGVRNFDDASWETFSAPDIMKRRTAGRLAFNWYRISLTIPEQVLGVETTGKTVVFDTTVDDYAEIWVDGELARAAGQMGGSVISSWNAANRVVIGRDVKPGQKIQLAIFGIYGSLSSPPTNFIWLHYAKLDFYNGPRGPMAVVPQEVNVEVIQNDPAINELNSNNPKIWKLADGFKFTEGPLWIPAGEAHGPEPAPGYLLFSDPNRNAIYKWSPDDGGKLSVFRRPSGYDGADIAEYGQPGSNGLAPDKQGRLTINEHGNHRVSRIEKDRSHSILVDRYEGKRLNSPNDLVYKSDGAVYFTDSPFGLPKFFDDPRNELPFSGVYRWKDGKVTLLNADLTGSKGIAFSPGETFLYVGNWDDKKKVVMRYLVNTEGTLDSGDVFFDMTDAKGEDAIDGIKVDVKGNLYVSGPGGLWILSPQGKHLGTVIGPKHPHNMAWGDADGKTLYLTAQSGLYKMRVNVPGSR